MKFPWTGRLKITGICMLLSLMVGCKTNTLQPPSNSGLFLDLSHVYEMGPPPSVAVPLVMNQSWLPTTLNQIEINHCQYYLTGFALQRPDSTWVEFPQAVTYADLERQLQYHWKISENVPSGTFIALRLAVGVDSLRNHSDPAALPVSNPLSLLSSAHMHWDWNTGYIFFKLEGQYQRPNKPLNGGFSYHLGGDVFYRPMILRFPPTTLSKAVETMQVDFRVNRFFDGEHTHYITDSSSFSHASLGDRVAEKLATNLGRAFAWKGMIGTNP
jgi:hypothetical protein